MREGVHRCRFQAIYAQPSVHGCRKKGSWTTFRQTGSPSCGTVYRTRMPSVRITAIDNPPTFREEPEKKKYNKRIVSNEKRASLNIEYPHINLKLQLYLMDYGVVVDPYVP